jgi:hypothetical protein
MTNAEGESAVPFKIRVHFMSISRIKILTLTAISHFVLYGRFYERERQIEIKVRQFWHFLKNPSCWLSLSS